MIVTLKLTLVLHSQGCCSYFICSVSVCVKPFKVLFLHTALLPSYILQLILCACTNTVNTLIDSHHLIHQSLSRLVCSFSHFAPALVLEHNRHAV